MTEQLFQLELKCASAKSGYRKARGVSLFSDRQRLTDYGMKYHTAFGVPQFRVVEAQS